MAAAVLNIALNYILLKRFGFGAGGVTLFISNVSLYLGCKFFAKSGLECWFNYLFICLCTSLALCAIIVLSGINVLHLNTMMAAGIAYLATYCLIVYTGYTFHKFMITPRDRIE